MQELTSIRLTVIKTTSRKGFDMNSNQADNLLASKQASSSAPRNLTLDVYKGLLIALVVIRHVLQYSVADEGGILTNFIWAVQMPGFMLVAGYFAARKVDSWSAVGKRILLSAQHYAVPFFSWFILVNCLLLGNYDRNPLTAIMMLSNRVDRGLWFLWVVFVLSIVATFANYTLGKEKVGILKTAVVLIVCFGVLAGLGIAFGINSLGIKFILYYAIFYGFGWIAHKTEDWWKTWWPSIENAVVAVALFIFLAIVYNFDLYHAADNVVGIVFRCVAGFTGNLVLLWCCSRYEDRLSKMKFGWIGMYTLEIYTTHMYVNSLMKAGNTNRFFTVPGFANFLFSLLLTVVFTAIIIAVFKIIPAFDFIFYGKKAKKTTSAIEG